MVEYSKRKYGCHFSYETDPQYRSFSFEENLGKTLGANVYKSLHKILSRCELNFSEKDKPT